MPARLHPVVDPESGELRGRWAELRLMRLGLPLCAGGSLPLSLPYIHHTRPRTLRRHTCAATWVRLATAREAASEPNVRASAERPDCPRFFAMRLHAGHAVARPTRIRFPAPPRNCCSSDAAL